MKKTFVLAMLLIVAAIGFAQSVPGATSYLVVTNVQTSPAQIYAGDYVNLTFLIYNTYSYPADGVVVQLTGGYPLMDISPSQTIKINSIPSGITQIGLEPLSYTIHVDPNAQAGTYTLNVMATYSSVTEAKLATGATSTLSTVRSDSMPISLRVRGAPHLSASVVSQGVVPGVASTVTLSILNDGTDTAKSASIELSPTSVFDVLGTSSTNLGDIEPGKTALASFSIRAKENAPSDKNLLPISLDYMNKYGKDFRYATNVSILVSVYDPKLDVSVSDTTSRPRAGKDSAIVLKVRNTGDGLAKNVYLAICEWNKVQRNVS